MNHSRRAFLRAAALTCPALASLAPRLLRAAETATEENLPPVRQLTKGPKFHWFGYYDKFQFSPDNRFILCNQVDFEHRTPKNDDVLEFGMIDTHEGDKWIPLGSTHAWCWQQGCMLQWIPGSKNEIIWNDRDGNHLVSHIMNVDTREKRTLPHPIYNIRPDGKFAVTLDFSRVHDWRAGYGYAGVPEPHKAVPAPKESGLSIIDLTSGDEKFIFSLADAAAFPYSGDPKMAFTAKSPGHRFEHLLYNTDGTRIYFLHRWQLGGGSNMGTRAITINPDGTDPFVIDPYGYTSHFIWRDPKHVLAYSWQPTTQHGFYLYTDHTDIVEQIGKGVLLKNGHETYLPGTNNQIILSDSYPDSKRLQHPHLYSVPQNRMISLAHFQSPPEYKGEFRCDTHPRSSRDGKQVCVDSPHNGGRQMYLIDISGLLPS